MINVNTVMQGLVGIFIAPILHANFLNVLASSVGIIVIGYLMIKRSWVEFVIVTCFCVPVAGMLNIYSSG